MNDKLLIIIAALLLIQLTTVLFVKYFGKRFADAVHEWLSSKSAPGKGGGAAVDVALRHYLQVPLHEIRSVAEHLLSNFGRREMEVEPIPEQLKADLPLSLRTVFERYSALTFEGERNVLNIRLLEEVTVEGAIFVVIGEAEDDGFFYAVPVGSPKIVVLEKFKQIWSHADEEADCWERLVVVQAILDGVGLSTFGDSSDR